MADSSPEQIKAEQERQESLSKQSASAKELANTFEKIAKAKGKINEEDRASISIAKQLSEFSSNIEKSIQKRLIGTASVKDLSKGLKELELDLAKNQRSYGETLKKINEDKSKALTKALDLHRKENKIKSDLAKLDQATAAAEMAAQIHLQNGNLGLAKQARDTAKENQRIAKLKEKELDTTIKEKDEQKNLVKSLRDAAQTHEKTIEEQEKEIALTKEAIKQKKKEEIQDELKKQFRVEEIKEMFTVLGLLKLMLEAALQFNSISVKTGKDLGYGADQADRVATNLVDMAQNSTNLNFTLKNAAEAMSDLNTATGGVAEYSADTLETQIMLTKQLGLSGEEAAGIYKSSVLTGKAASQVNDEMVAAFASTRNMVKGSANFKATMAEAAKVSGQLAINFKNNPAEITKAIVQAQKLGTTLEQTKNQGKQLLDFESSISNELEAELMTGQQMNLERARAAALMGDQVTVMKELANQGMTLEKFQSMNVLAQESYAKALGLSADELSEQLRKQKIATEQGKSLAEINAEEAKEAEKRQAIQDKFNAAVDKLKDVIGNLVAGPLAMFLDGLSTALNIIGYIVKPIEWIADLAGYIGKTFAGWASALGPVGVVLKVLAGIAIVIAAYGAYAALAWIPVVGPILGAAAAVAVMAKGFSALSGAKSAGDMISPADGKTQVSTKEGGLFELSKNDDVLAGPGLAKAAKGGKGESISPNIDLTPMIAAIREVKASVDRLYGKDTSINMDGKKVGTTLTQGSYKVA